MILAQLSDIHADGSETRLHRLDAVLKWLEPLRPDGLIVSGDLAEAEHRRSYRAVRQRLESSGVGRSILPTTAVCRSATRLLSTASICAAGMLTMM